MISPFDENGYLPPGVHPATLEEVIARFGSANEERIAEAESLEWLTTWCVLAGVERLLIDGSFVTDRDEPGDVDCLCLLASSVVLDSDLRRQLVEGWPYLEVKVVSHEDFDTVAEFLSTDRVGIDKGLLEVLL